MYDTRPMPLIAKVAPGPGDAMLRVWWKAGGMDMVDLTGILARVKGLAPLRDPDLFRRVKVITRGNGVGWPGDLDLSATTLERLAEEQRPFGADDFAAWQTALSLSNQEAADVLGCTLGTVKNYRGGATIPTAVKIACRALARDPTAFRAHFRPRTPGRPRKAA